MVKKTWLSINAIAIGSLAIAIIIISTNYNKRITRISDDYNASYSELEGQYEALNQEIDKCFDLIELNQKEYEDKLSQLVESIPEDKDTDAKNTVAKWLNLIDNKQEKDIDIDEVGRIMGVNTNHYHEWYPDFYSDASKSKLDYMMDTVFQYGETYTVKPQRYTENYDDYIVEDTDGNKFYLTYNHDGTIYSMWTFAYYCDYNMDLFVKALENKDIDTLFSLIYYENYDPYEELVKDIYDEYINVLNTDSLGYQFIGIDLHGFKYNLYDRSGHELKVYVRHADSITSVTKVDEWAED